MPAKQQNLSIHLGDAHDLVLEFLMARADEVTLYHRTHIGDRRYRHKPSSIAKQILVEAAEHYFARTKRPRPGGQRGAPIDARPPLPPHPPRPPATAGPGPAASVAP